MKQLVLASVVAAALVSAAASLPANTCIVSGSLDGPTPSSSSTVAMSGGLDSTWRSLASYTAERFWPHKPIGLVITFK